MQMLRLNQIIPLLLALLLLGACSATASREANERAPAPEPPTPTRAVPTPVIAPVNAPGLCTSVANAPPVIDDGAPLMTADNVRYDEDENTIVLRDMAPTTLAAVSNALDRPDLLLEITPGEWLLSANLQIESGATLFISAPAVRWLKLRSDAEGFVWIKAFGGRLDFVNTCVTSWNPSQATVDEDWEDGRSFVLARSGAHMEIYGSDLRYLGYPANESYGVSYRLAGTSGQVAESILAYNYYGLYTYQASDLIIQHNDVHHNVLYGIDPHTESNRLLIEGNIAHHNGKHGIILAVGCSNSIIRNNFTFANKLHGITLFDGSNDNLVEGNISYANGDPNLNEGKQGININNSSGNIVRNNTTHSNVEDGIGVGQSARGNLIVGNTVHTNQRHGLHFFSAATENTARENVISNNAEYGIYVDSENNLLPGGNEIFGNRIGVYLNVAQPADLSLEHNRIFANTEENIRTP